jgi:hypothetical protein
MILSSEAGLRDRGRKNREEKKVKSTTDKGVDRDFERERERENEEPKTSFKRMPASYVVSLKVQSNVISNLKNEFTLFN